MKLILAANMAVLLAGAAGGQVPSSKPPMEAKIMADQVALDRAGFSPGVIDGKPGFTLKLALSGFQKASKLKATGSMDQPTAAALTKLSSAPAVITINLTKANLAGPYVGLLPRSEDAQAKLPALGYANVLEMIAERYHTTPETLIALNSPDTRLAAGSAIKVPNVATTAHGYPNQMPDGYKRTLFGLNVPSDLPNGDHLVVSKSKRSLSVFDDVGKLVAQFPVTTGSSHDPLPIGHWKVVGASYNPKFHYNPKLFWDASKSDKQATLQPGPNGPVGIIWLDLSKPHYGIHGTPQPQNIGRTESHGCVRMTNWDAGRLSLMVKPGMPVVFER